MAFDGIAIANLVYELKEKLPNARIYKIAQPESDELILTLKSSLGQHRLLISASASLPLIYLTENNKPSPMTAPNFCMLLRKHLSNGRITSITQPGLERIINFEIEHLNELGDLCKKYLIVEIMGKHSNIIFCDDNNNIIDSIKHVSAHMSSVREVLPGRDYFIPQTQDKFNPLETSWESFKPAIGSKPVSLAKALYTSYTGISPAAAEEICYRASLDSSTPANVLGENELLHLYHIFSNLIEDIKNNRFQPTIVYKDEEPIEFSSIELTHFEGMQLRSYSSISQVLETFYATKNTLTRIRQKSYDLRHVVQLALERSIKKYDLQLKQLKDTQKRDKYKVYGELLNTYGYNLEEGAKELEALNYYTNEMIKIPLDETLSAKENAKKYFDKYNKLKRTFEALSSLTQETKDEINHLESISTALDIALTEDDLVQLKEELMDYGYMKRKGSNKKQQKIKSKPFHYLSSDGYHIYVGKNNFQNEELTFKFATGNDWWFHAKGIPGSHVILKANGEEIPDKTFEEAGRLAAYYSKGRGTDKIEIDYVEKKHIKKPSGAKPGFVVYYTNYSLLIDSNITGIEQISD
ncbi:Rqc2 family fibronectin-binding protein [Candidatus Galacturonibacter soehngenii]|uniref:Rqc2 homolog RqcH n=1 Tax=Candidatus Galacturonatibacter soehngenii TaxID=2307010 RepID=A0A7V7UB71_9FIRM|nr:NFACT RNA binding domain-containing protein [Candidatus Galacturonibacter soehngenii]KAB1437660.1 fibronectin/fibrinogen-binding protein [Candidatus Galacturonibacter soehngenii]MBA4686887.1 NFACT family protein [Candidatus Galacturonibacter soehngenii]